MRADCENPKKLGQGLSRNSRDFSLPFPSYAGMLLADASISSPRVPANRNHGSISARPSLQMEARASDADVFTSGFFVTQGREGKPEGQQQLQSPQRGLRNGRGCERRWKTPSQACPCDEPTPPPVGAIFAFLPPPNLSLHAPQHGGNNRER